MFGDALKEMLSQRVKNQRAVFQPLLPPPPSSVFVSTPLAPAKLPHKMVKCKAATTWEVITAEEVFKWEGKKFVIERQNK